MTLTSYLTTNGNQFFSTKIEGENMEEDVRVRTLSDDDFTLYYEEEEDEENS